MSVYRKFDEGAPNDIFIFSERRYKVSRAPVSPKVNALIVEGDQRRKRKQTSTNELLKPTLRWAAELPRSVRPRAVMCHFPRIANQLAGMWSDAPAVRSYLKSLLVDDRGNRKGFPPNILRELLALRLYHEDLRPQKLTVRDGGNKQVA